MSSVLAEVSKELTNLQQIAACISSGMDSTISLAKDVLQSVANEDARDVLPSVTKDDVDLLRSCMLQYAEMDAVVGSYFKSAESGMLQLQKSSAELKAEAYRNIEDLLKAEKDKDRRSVAEKHKRYCDLCNVISESLNTAAHDEEQGDEDCRFSVENVIPIDPLTQVEVKDPVKNRHCNHTYDRASIMQYISTRQKARCPHLACANNIALRAEDLVENVQVLRLLKKKSAAKH